MKNAITTLLTLLVLVSCRPHRTGSGMMFETDCPKVNEAWELAVKTVRYNIRDSILAAGADYGGEWTRDVAINTWNGTDLFIPEVMERSLWHVTDGRRTVGHQYWDKIIWVQGAYYHYLLTRDTNFLKEAYICSHNTMKQLEDGGLRSELRPVHGTLGVQRRHIGIRRTHLRCIQTGPFGRHAA